MIFSKMIRGKIARNASWLIACRIVQSIMSLIVTMITARYLGPSNYGLLNYAASVVSFVAPIALLGLNNVLVQEYVSHPSREGEINGSALSMSLCSAVLCICGVIAFAGVTNRTDTECIIVCGLYSLMLISQVLELIQYWFQYKYLSKYTAIVSCIAYFIISGYKIFLLVSGKSIRWFAVSNALDYFIIACSLYFIYKKLGGAKLSFSFKTVRSLLSKGKYYILANMMICIFSQTDRIMLKLMIGNDVTGIYSAAVTCAALANFVFVAIIDSFRPDIFERKKQNHIGYEEKVKLLYTIVIVLSLVECVLICVLAKPIVYIVYGNLYMDSVSTLRIAVWYTPFSFIGMIRNIWLLAEGKQKWIWKMDAGGAALNVLLNYLLIPVLGSNGAAIASVMTEFFTNVVLSFAIKDIRGNFKIMVNALKPKQIKKCISMLFSKKPS